MAEDSAVAAVGSVVGAAASGAAERAASLAGMAWLYALHARSSLARGRVWQAEYMISGVRDHVLALACVRYGVPAVQGRGMDQLPAEVLAGFAAGLVRSVEAGELERAFLAVTESLIAEIGLADDGLAGRVDETGEVAGAEGYRRYADQRVGGVLAIAEAAIDQVEESAVAAVVDFRNDERASKDGAEFVLAVDGRGGGKEAAGIEDVVAQIIERRQVLHIFAQAHTAGMRANWNIEFCRHQNHGKILIHACKTAAVDLAYVDRICLQ